MLADIRVLIDFGVRVELQIHTPRLGIGGIPRARLIQIRNQRARSSFPNCWERR